MAVQHRTCRRGPLARASAKQEQKDGAAKARSIGCFRDWLGVCDEDAVLRRADPAEAVATIRCAAELGIDLLDTSDAYGNGRNEELIGRAIEGRRSEYIIASKFGNLRRHDGTPTADGRPEYVRLACERSLRRLRTEMIDLYYIHRVDPAVPIEETVGAMSVLVREGKVRFLGISEASPRTIRRAHATHAMTAVQIEYSLRTRDVEGGVLDTCRELGIGFVAYSPLRRGFLTGTVTGREDLREGDARLRMPRFQDDNLRQNLQLVAGLPLAIRPPIGEPLAGRPPLYPPRKLSQLGPVCHRLGRWKRRHERRLRDRVRRERGGRAACAHALRGMASIGHRESANPSNRAGASPDRSTAFGPILS
jgi:aryl-alcohol dehydrogenase-like predicted oxidoreductase